MELPTFGLRARLIALIAFAVVPAIALNFYSAVQQRESAALAAIEDARNVGRLAAREQSRLIAGSKQLLQGLALLPEMKDPRQAPACTRALSELVKAYPFYTSFGVATLDGNVWCSSRPLPGKVNVGDRVYFRRAVESNNFSVGNYIFGRVTGVHAFNVGQPLFINEKLVGVMYVGVNLNWVNEMLSAIRLPENSVVFVVDSEGTLLARYPEVKDAVGKSLNIAALTNTMLKNDQEGTADVLGSDGVDRFFAYAPLKDTAGGNVYVAVGVSKNVVYASAQQQFTRNLMLLLVVATIALIAAWGGSNAFVLKRIKALATAAQRLAAGDLQARTGLPHGKEELGHLASTFDRMANGLQLMSTALSRVHRALKALTAANRAVARASDEQALMVEICSIVAKTGGYRCSWIGHVGHEDNRRITLSTSAGFENEFALSNLNATWGNGASHSFVAQAIREVRPVVLHNILTDYEKTAYREEAVRYGYASAAAFPIVILGKVVAVFVIHSEESNAFESEELDLLHEIAQDLAFGVSTLRARQEHDRALEHMAYYDSLTGLPNRAYFERRVHQTISSHSNTQSFALMIIDLNRLWEVNDALGFHHGDSILKEVSNRLKELFADDTIVARMRGDEFAVLLPAPSREHVENAVLCIQTALNETVTINEISVDVSVVIGISLFPQHGTEPIQLIRHADVAMHQAKKSGSRHGFYTAENDADSKLRLAMVTELRHAIEHDELVLHYQPKIDVQTGRICGLEALVRWHHPTKGMIPPDAFIPLAEQTWLIKPLTEWVLKTALRQTMVWHKSGWKLPVAVNLSAKNLHDESLVKNIEQLIAETGAEPWWLELEITEGAVMDDPEHALRTLNQLSAMGIILYIDDFGTGYSSLRYLNELPVDAVKIDKSFVLNMLDQPGAAAIVRSTISLAHDLGLRVVAEGVENEEMWTRLVTLKCDSAQGFYFSKPLPADKCLEQFALQTKSRAFK